MNIKVLKQKDALSIEEALDVKGGLSSSFNLSAMECTCDCFISNKNESRPQKPFQPKRSTNN